MIPHILLKIGSSGATVRMYVDTYEADKSNQLKSAGKMSSKIEFFFVKSERSYFLIKLQVKCWLLVLMLPCKFPNCQNLQVEMNPQLLLENDEKMMI